MLRNTASLIEWVMNSPAKPSAWNSSQRLVVEVLAGDLVDGAERLVEQEHRRLQRQRAGQRAAHPHAARQRLRVVVLEARSGRPCSIAAWASRPRSALVDAAQLGEQLDVLAHGAPRQQRGVLEHVAEVVAVDVDRARRSASSSPEAIRSSVDLPQPGRADDGDELAAADARTTRRRWPRVPSGNVIPMWSKVTPWVPGGEPRGMQFLSAARQSAIGSSTKTGIWRVGLRLVVGVVGEGGDGALPPLRLLVAGDLAGDHVLRDRAVLQLDVRVGDEVVVPDRVLRGAAERGHGGVAPSCSTRISGVLRSLPVLAPTRRQRR